MPELPRHPLRRYYGQRDLHFITTSCYRRKPLPGTARARDTFLEVLELVRRRYGFDVIGFVVMPEHIHLLIRAGEGRSIHRNAGVKANRRAPFAPQATEEEYFPDGTVEEPIRSRTVLAKTFL